MITYKNVCCTAGTTVQLRHVPVGDCSLVKPTGFFPSTLILNRDLFFLYLSEIPKLCYNIIYANFVVRTQCFMVGEAVRYGSPACPLAAEDRMGSTEFKI